MSKQKKRNNPSPEIEAAEPATQAPTLPWSPIVRNVVSVLILLHLVAVFIAPLSMLMPAASLVDPIRQKFAPYHQLTYLGHGYQFFAPDPGPSHIVQYTAVDADGNKVNGHFPDRDKHWPRLHYHRWFMLSERTYELRSQLMSDKEFAEMIANMDRDIETARQRGDRRVVRNLEREQESAREAHLLVKQQVELLTSAIEGEIKRRYGATDVTITCVERVLPAPYEISEDKRQLDDDIYLPTDRKLKLRKTLPTDKNAEEIK